MFQVGHWPLTRPGRCSGDGPVLLLLQLLLELFLLGRQRLQPPPACSSLSHPLLRGREKPGLELRTAETLWAELMGGEARPREPGRVVVEACSRPLGVTLGLVGGEARFP